MNAIETILEPLKGEFAIWDAKVLADSLVWAANRTAAIKEFESNEENIKMRRVDVWGFYKRVHSIAGGKTWYGVCGQNSPARRDEFVTKNCAAVAASRDMKIAKQLVKLGVISIDKSEVVRSTDGFHGVFAVESAAGRNIITIRTIFAGGYNIQCAHTRTLVKVS
jgi:hypothetical protein